ncbi:hypothetical protein SAY87_025889 [Trapa incisa]|uniref:Uncharacterized protein n=1 Tax=Trapa incisa TaxID=236973 RepID=A0AAN7GUJ7_9MYRT|nr:hypothetical protein SAY87_025889 [Trapa incisa]
MVVSMMSSVGRCQGTAFSYPQGINGGMELKGNKDASGRKGTGLGWQYKQLPCWVWGALLVYNTSALVLWGSLPS